MAWTNVLAACAVASIAASLTDWFFFGFLFHDKYQVFPEVWRLPPGADEGRTVLRASIVGVLTPVCFVLMCDHLRLVDANSLTILVTGIWGMTAVPMLVTNYLFMKIHRLTIVAHALGWLAKLAVSAIAVAWLLP